MSQSLVTSAATCRLIFVTGTDTGAGKTILTALLLDHLRRNGTHALAIKPFCSGDRGDVDLLQRVQEYELRPEEANPFYFSQPLAPLAAARRSGRTIPFGTVLNRIRRVAKRCDSLLIEGAGGLLAPLGEGYCLLDLIKRTRGEVLVAAKNQLGTLNHTMLTLAALTAARIRRVKVVLMNMRRVDASSQSNPRLLAELVAPIPVFVIPCIAGRKVGFTSVVRSRSRLSTELSRILR